MRALKTILAMLVAATLLPLPLARAQTQSSTLAEQIQIWNVSLKLVNSTESEIYASGAAWRAAFKEMASDEYLFRPDLITVLEVPFKDQGEIKAEMESQLGAQYGSVHSDYGISFCETNRHNDCGNTLLAWRKARFSKTVDSSGNGKVKRWPQFSDQNGDNDCNDSGDLNKHNGSVFHDQIAARLKDDAKGKIVVLSGVHFAAGASASCLSKNVEKVSDLLESTWSNRPLSVVTGDFNRQVDIHAGDDGIKRSHWRRETDTACWYEQFSALHPDRSICQRFSSWYYDAVWAENAGANPSSGICAHWTFWNTGTNYSTAAGCDSGRKRIDYVWIRYENDSGIRQELSLTQIQVKIVEAGSDRGYYEAPDGTREAYSDHRALHARILW